MARPCAGRSQEGWVISPLMTAEEAAGMLRVSTKTLQRLRTRGLPFVMLTPGTIRYRKDDIDAYLQEHTECHTARKARATGTMTSKSGVVDFTALAEQRTMRKRKQ
ncbi:helix-turn-helix domain-containing protein [Paracoccus sulfuroxidans]|uniref:helix-turn-helix domain-containing protein n=1 Tax=Paracoccus sulfuroxidans TaxID=384678 RepID=UPI003BB1442D